MIDFKVAVDARAALDALERLERADLKAQIAKTVADEVVLPALMKYPPQSRAKMSFASTKQRRYFFAALRDGRIQVPYRRTGTLGREWDQKAEPDGMTLTSQAPYSDLVRTQGQQAKYHAGTWETVESLAAAIEGDVTLAATAEIVKIIGEAGP